MAVLYVSEFADVGHIQGVIPVGAEPANNDQSIAITGSSAQSAAFLNNTTLVRIHNDGTAACAILFGTNPTATTTSTTQTSGRSRRIAANGTEYFTVPVGAAYKIAVIATT